MSRPVPVPASANRLTPESATAVRGQTAQAFSSLAPFGSSPRSPDIARAFLDYFGTGAATTATVTPPAVASSHTNGSARTVEIGFASAPSVAGPAAADGEGAAYLSAPAPTMAPAGPVPGSSAGALLTRAMTFNVRYDTAADGPDAWPYRLDDLADLVGTYRPLVAGLQEALAHQVHQLASRLAKHGYRWVGVGRDDGGDAGEFCPIFYDDSELTLHDWDVFWLSDDPSCPGSRHADAALPRICTWAKLQRRAGPASHKPFFVFNTHFDHAGPKPRQFSVGVLLAKITEIAGLYPCLVLGDLNCTRAEETYRLATASFLVDAFVEGPQPGDTSPTFTGFRIDSDDSSAVTIDYVLASGFFVAGYKVLRERRRDGRRISDHRPVLVDVLFKTYT